MTRPQRKTNALRTLAVAAFAALSAGIAYGAEERSPCTEDAMIVFDASGSMSGNGWAMAAKLRAR